MNLKGKKKKNPAIQFNFVYPFSFLATNYQPSRMMAEAWGDTGF